MGTGDAGEHSDPLTSEDVPTGFDRALEGLTATGASATMRDLVALLARHGSEEGRILAQYEAASTDTRDTAARYLIDLIMSDERRHHRTLVEMATSMAWDTLGGGDAVPPLGLHSDAAFAAATRRLREYEEQDRRELLTLRRKLRPFEETTLWGLLVDLMILDTEKHATILRFLERHARGD